MPASLLPAVDHCRCTSCGDCLAVCPTQCLSLSGQGEVVCQPRHCINCSLCEAVCPVAAIAMRLQAW